MKDRFNREIDSLRISITQECNLSCPYCHKEGEKDNKEETSLDKIKDIIIHAKELGFKKIKITGGEPLLREDLIDIIKTIKNNGFLDISLVTNGLLLENKAKQIKEAGLNRINIGCDSLNSDFLLKNRNNIEAGLKAAKEAGLSPIKLNMVILKGINDNEIEDMINFARENNTILQLIELVDVEKDFYEKFHLDLEEIEKALEKKAKKIMIRKLNNRKQYDLGNVIVEVVRPSHGSFCRNCKKLRVTSDGRLKPCLMMNDNLVKFKNKDSFIEAIDKRVVYHDRHN